MKYQKICWAVTLTKNWPRIFWRCQPRAGMRMIARELKELNG